MDSNIDSPAPEASRYGLNRAAILEWLYNLDGRQDPSHPQHSLYTGLADKYRYEFGTTVLECLTRCWHEEGQRGAVIYAEGHA
ncbi:MAG: hypothetical protein ACO4AL_12285 [Steroidobacteraceae bacterium]